MKTLKYILSAVLLFAIAWGCTKEEEFGSLEFLSTAEAPSNVTAFYSITQDNTGLVTITPNGDGANSFDVYLGDGTTDAINVKLGENLSNIYSEGNYNPRIVAYDITGLSTEAIVPLVVSFKAPQNLVVTIENSKTVSQQVNVIANAEFATFFEVYFGEEGSDDPVTANIGETASFIYQEVGTYTIRVVAKGGAIATTEYTEDFLVTAIQQPIAAAPAPPARNAVDVISIFSGAYDNIGVSEWNPGWGQSTVLSDFVVDGDTILKYDFLNYSGIVTNYDNPTNLSGMEFVHFDYWTNDAETFGLKIVNTSQPDGPTKESEVVISEITTGEWVSVDIPLADYTTDMSAITQFVLSSSGVTVFLDNLYFYVATPSAPITGAPVPTNHSSVVTSIFSDSYTPLATSEWNPGWGQSTVLTTVDVDGNPTLKYDNLDFTGIVTDYGNPTNLTERTHVHFDYWTGDATKLELKLVNTVIGQEDKEAVSSIKIGQWVSVDIALADYDMDLSGVTQMLFESSGGTVYIDNFYFYTELPAAPSTGAPVPTTDAAGVISIFSDSYTPLPTNEWNPGWGQTTILTTVDIDGNATLKYDLLNFTGIVTDYGNPTDISGKTHVHFDYWVSDIAIAHLKLKLVSAGEEDMETVPNLTFGRWVSVDIPLSDYAITDKSGLIQLIFDSTGGTVFIDNLYFY